MISQPPSPDPAAECARLQAVNRELLEACKYAAKYLGPNDPSNGSNCWLAHAKLEAAIAYAKQPPKLKTAAALRAQDFSRRHD